MKKGKLMIAMMAVCTMMVAVLSTESNKTDIDDLAVVPAIEQTFVAAQCIWEGNKTDIDYL